ncbi:MAG: hypothetical protein ACYDH0_00940 [Candidatus Aminicenantales bacterium]
MKSRMLSGLLVISLLWIGGCKALVDKCELDNTGTFSLENASASGKTYKILIDGINYGIVGAGQTKEWELTAGTHVVQILFAETGNAACSISAPSVIKCKKSGLRCDA